MTEYIAKAISVLLVGGAIGSVLWFLIYLKVGR